MWNLIILWINIFNHEEKKLSRLKFIVMNIVMIENRSADSCYKCSLNMHRIISCYVWECLWRNAEIQSFSVMCQSRDSFLSFQMQTCTRTLFIMWNFQGFRYKLSAFLAACTIQLWGHYWSSPASSTELLHFGKTT